MSWVVMVIASKHDESGDAGGGKLPQQGSVEKSSATLTFRRGERDNASSHPHLGATRVAGLMLSFPWF